MADQRDELDVQIPLILKIGVWLNALAALLVALMALASPVHMLAGGSGEFTLLGVRWGGETDAGSIAGAVGFGLAMLGYAVYLVHACTEVPLPSRFALGVDLGRRERQPPARAVAARPAAAGLRPPQARLER